MKKGMWSGGKHSPGVMCKQGPFGEWCFSCKRLLSSAPEMLQMLRAAVVSLLDDESYQKHKELIHSIDKVVKKAEGKQ